MKVRIGYMPGAFPSGNDGSGNDGSGNDGSGNDGSGNDGSGNDGSGKDAVKYLRDLVKVGDKYGYDSLWLSDRVVGERPSPEPLIALSMVAAYSDRLKFGTSVLQLPIRNPVILAKEMATLDYLSEGRFLPAIGLGQEDPREYEACGVSKEDRGRRTDEALVVMRRLWHEDNVTHQGRFFSLRDVTINPKPVQVPSLPVWIGGRTKAAQRRVGRIGDGWLVSSATPREVKDGVEVVFSTAAEHRREVDEDHIGVLVTYLIAPTVEDAASAAEPYVTRARTDAQFTEYTALGTPAQVEDMIGRYLEAGASKFVVRPLCPPQQAIEQLEIFGQEILPHFHR